MGRVLGVDVGRVRIGLAVSDPEGVVARPLEVLEATPGAPEAIGERALELSVEEVVVGYPLRMDGRPGEAAEGARAFAAALRERTGLPVHLWDERLSTREAERAMRAGGETARRQRGRVDSVAAALILQAYLESRR